MINSTWNRISSLKVFHVLLYQRSSILQEFLLSLSYSMICFWIDWVRMYKYTKIKRLDSREITSIAKEQTRDENSTSFESSPKINRMLITRPILACENMFLLALRHWGRFAGRNRCFRRLDTFAYNESLKDLTSLPHHQHVAHKNSFSRPLMAFRCGQNYTDGKNMLKT